MSELTTANKLKFTYNVCAVMFGTDDTLLKIKLSDGFSFVRKSLMPLIDHLDKIFEVDAWGLRREFETARVDDNSLDVICVIKQITVYLDPSQTSDYFDKAIEHDLISIDNQIRAIRLLNECSLRFNKISFKLCSEKYTLDGVDAQINHSAILPIGESMGSKTVMSFHSDDDLAETISNRLLSIQFPIADKVLNTCHIHYDLSYHQDNHISITLLITALEMLYLENENAKKDKLSKRCSVYLYEEKDSRLSCCQRLRCLYKKRSEFVHEGIFDCIDNEDIIFLRNCVRMSLFSMLSESISKKERIENLKIVVLNSNYWST